MVHAPLSLEHEDHAVIKLVVLMWSERSGEDNPECCEIVLYFRKTSQNRLSILRHMRFKERAPLTVCVPRKPPSTTVSPIAGPADQKRLGLGINLKRSRCQNPDTLRGTIQKRRYGGLSSCGGWYAISRLDEGLVSGDRRAIRREIELRPIDWRERVGIRGE